MGSLIRTVTGLSGIGYGVNLWEVPPTSGVRAVSNTAIGMVAELPWGPPDEIVTVTTPAEFFDTFYPNSLAATKDSTTYPAIRALLNKPIFTKGGLKVVRVGATSHAKATSAAITAGTGTITIRAKYAGAIGEEISYQWTAATDADANHRNLVITATGGYTATYENLDDDTIASLVDDPLVDIVLASPTDMPTAGAATALGAGTAGSDGTAVAADYVGGPSSAKGIRLFYGEGIDVAALFVAECPSALVDDVNTGLEAYATDADKGIAVLCTVDGDAPSDAITYVDDYRDDRIAYRWPRVLTTDFFDADVPEVEVDGNAFYAAAIANVDPWLSVGGAGKRQGGVDLFAGITGLEDESVSRANYDLLRDAGIGAWFIDRKLGVIVRGDVSTATTGRTRIYSRRMTDYLLAGIADFAVEYVETPLDIDLTNQVLGDNTGAFVGGVTAFLQGLVDAGRIAAYSVDPFSGTSAGDKAAGRWTVLIAVQLVSMAEEIVLKAQIGETVTIAEAA